MKFKKINVSKLFNREGNSSFSSFPMSRAEREACSGACKKNDGSCMTMSEQGGCHCRYEDNTRGCSDRPLANGWEGMGAKRIDKGGNAPKTPSCRDSVGSGTGGKPYEMPQIRDRGNEPIVFDIRREAFMTPDFRTALWTGGNLQLTVMTIPVGEDIGVEKHENLDQLIGVISGAGEVSFGNRENYLASPIPLDAHSVVLVPAGTYHNVKNVGKTPLKLYSVYAPKAHKFGTVEKTKE